MSPLTVFLLVLAMSLAIIIIFDVIYFLQFQYAHAITLVNGQQYANDYFSTLSRFVIYLNVFAIIGFILSIVILIMYYKSR